MVARQPLPDTAHIFWNLGRSVHHVSHSLGWRDRFPPSRMDCRKLQNQSSFVFIMSLSRPPPTISVNSTTTMGRILKIGNATFIIQGNAGIEQSLLIVGITAMVCCIALVAGVGITQRCHIDTGGVHDILSHILGARLGGAVSVVYCFGQVRGMASHA